MNNNKIQYFLLFNGKKWIESERIENKKEVNLYDFINGEMNFKGIGQY